MTSTKEKIQNATSKPNLAKAFAVVAAAGAFATVGSFASAGAFAAAFGVVGIVGASQAAERGHLGESLRISGTTLACAVSVGAVSVGALTSASLTNLPAEADNPEEQPIEEVCDLVEEKDVIEELRSEGLCL